VTQIEALARRAAAAGVAIQTLSSFAVSENALAGIVLGYRSAEYVHYDHCIIRTRSFTSRNGTGPSSEIDNARETPHSSHGGDEGLGAMADGPS
jgi:hypothetical protein